MPEKFEQMIAKLRGVVLVTLLSVAAALLPTVSRGDSTAIVNINQANLSLQICGSGCVQVLQQYNIAVVIVSQGPDFAPAIGAAFLAPGRFDFGNVTHAKSTDFTLTDTSSRQPLLVSGIALSGAQPDDFSLSHDCGLIIAPGHHCTIHVTFAPTDMGARSAVLAVRDSAIDSPQKVDLTGTGVAPSISPAGLDFGSAAIGTAAAGKAVTVHNPASDALTVSGASLSGDNSGDFGADACGTIAAGGSCSMPVSFKPADAGPRRATLSVQHNGLGPALTVTLAGMGVPLSLTPSSRNFGNVLVGTASGPQDFNLQNMAASALTITSLGFASGNASDFKSSSCGNLPLTLAGGAQCLLHVTFTPAATGPRASSLGLQYSAGGAQFSAAADVAGTGVQPGLGMSPAVVDFGRVTLGNSASQAVTLTNTGTASLTISSLGLTGGNAGDFAQSGCGTLPAVLAPGDSCQMQMTFTPRAAGNRGSSLKVGDDSPGSPHLLSVTGSGAANPPPATSSGPPPATGGGSLPVASSGTVTAASAGGATPAATPGLPKTGAQLPQLTARCLVGFVSPAAGQAEAVWLIALGALLVLSLSAAAWRRRRRRPSSDV